MTSDIRDRVSTFLDKDPILQDIFEILAGSPANSAHSIPSIVASVAALNRDSTLSPDILSVTTAPDANARRAMANNLDRLRKKLEEFDHTPAGLSSTMSVLLHKHENHRRPYTLVTRLRSGDQRFWGQNFAMFSQEEQSNVAPKLRVIYNAMLCFRDYPDNVLIRSTDINNEKHSDHIDRFFKELNLSREGFIATRQYLLAGEIDARDRIARWFHTHCPSVHIHTDLASHDIDQSSIETFHLVLLGNPRTNWLIHELQSRNQDFRYQLETQHMELCIRDAHANEATLLGDVGRFKGTSYYFKDDAYDGRRTTRSFVVLTRCPHLLNPRQGGCTSIASFSNAAIGEVAKALVHRTSTEKLLTKIFDNDGKLPDRFQCLIEVHTDAQTDPHLARDPHCLAYHKY